jgi:hypothetical protein
MHVFKFIKEKKGRAWVRGKSKIRITKERRNEGRKGWRKAKENSDMEIEIVLDPIIAAAL